MYAVVERGGKQYRWRPDVIIGRSSQEEGQEITLEESCSWATLRGSVRPLVEGAKVTAKQSNTERKKILVFRYKPKKNFRKRYGHRQPYTRLLIQQ